MSQQQAALKNSLVAGNPYLSYARLKSSSGPDALMPVCRDPYCTGCQLNSHLLASSASAVVANGKLASSTSGAAGSCPAGCAQCDHKPGYNGLRSAGCSRIRTRTTGSFGSGLATPVRVQLDSRRYGLLWQKIFHVGRIVATSEESHERVE